MTAGPPLQRLPWQTVFLILLWLWLPPRYAAATAPLPPLPVLPIPSYSQLQWHKRETIMHLHFGMNTFASSEWDSGKENPKLFNPSALDTRQWLRVAKQAGFSLVVLTAKHHDGFCLWPSAYTDYSVRASSWKGGQGDVVGELAAAAQEEGIDLGLYLSPWDRHDPR